MIDHKESWMTKMWLSMKHLLQRELVDAWHLLQSRKIFYGIPILLCVPVFFDHANMSVLRMFLLPFLLTSFLLLATVIILPLAFAIKPVWEVLSRIWVIACLVVIFCASIIFVPQVHEVLIGLAEPHLGYSSRWSYMPYWSFWLGIAVLSFYTWLYARYMLLGCNAHNQLLQILYTLSPGVLAVAPLLAILYSLIQVKWQYDLLPETEAYIATWFPIYIIATFVVMSALIFCMEKHTFIKRLKNAAALKPRPKPLTINECKEHIAKSNTAKWLAWIIFALAWLIFAIVPLLALTVLFAFPFILDHADSLLGPASWLIFWAIGMMAVGTLIHFGHRSTELQLIPVILFLPIAFAVPGWNDNHEIELLPAATLAEAGRPGLAAAEMSRNTEDSDGKTEEFEEANERFKGWLKPRLEIWRKQHPNAPYPVFIIAAEGGGARAGHWTATVLGTLQDYCPQFAQHVFAISGVSGGSVGAAVFAASVAQAGHKLNSDPCRSGTEADDRRYRDMANKFFAQDLLSPLLVGALVHDLIQRTIPFPFGELDRARAFEHGLENAWRVADGNSSGDNRFAKAFTELWSGSADTAVPYLFLNATRVETGQRAVLSPFALAGMPSNCSSPGECFANTIDLSEFAKAFKLSTAVHLSARFPYLSPAGGISGDGNIAGRYVDGGYYDNSGALTAMDIADTIMALQQTSKNKDFEVIVISIKNSPESPELVKHSIAQDVKRSPKQPLPELLSPIRTLLGMREERGAKTVNRMIDWAKRRGLSGSAIFQMQYSNGAPMTLGWALCNSSWEHIGGILSKCSTPEDSKTPENYETRFPLESCDALNWITSLFSPMRYGPSG